MDYSIQYYIGNDIYRGIIYFHTICIINRLLFDKIVLKINFDI